MEKINRKLFKSNARMALKNHFWLIMLVVVVASTLGSEWTGLLNNGGFYNVKNYSNKGKSATVKMLFSGIEEALNDSGELGVFHYDYEDGLSEKENIEKFFENLGNHLNMSEEQLIQMICMGIGIACIIFLIVYAVMVVLQFLVGSFLSAPVGVGCRRFFMKNRKGSGEFKDLFAAFCNGKYVRTVKAMFSTNIRIFGWSLMFYFPGLVKYYQYYFVSYIVAENPGISKDRVREISKEMTRGHKWQMFVMELSFLGWILLFVLAEVVLALISCGIFAIPGMVLIFPIAAYQKAAFAELYAERREYALMTGVVSQDELIGF